MVSLFARTTRRVGMAHIRHVTPVTMRAAPPAVATIYRAIERDFGMLAPPLALHAGAPTTLAAVWLMLRETLLVPGLVTREAKEVVAAAVSLANRCPYCVEVHGTTLYGLLPGSEAEALAADRVADLTDTGLRRLALWARGSGEPPPDVPFPLQHAPEILGLAMTFHYINRMVNIFLQESPLPALPSAAVRPVRRRAARILVNQTRIAPRPGQSAMLLPEAPLPDDLGWAAGRPTVASALARASAAVDAAGVRSVPGPVRRLVLARLTDSTAVPDGPGSRVWLAEAVAGVPNDQRSAARLALLTAFASYQVTARTVAEFRDAGHGDEAVLELTSWASLAAARRVANNLHRDREPPAEGG